VADRLAVVGEPPAAIDAAAPDLAGREGGVASAERDRHELERLRSENARLEAIRRELLETLEVRMRRVDQLLGERNQLERQLARSELALQDVNRTLGALGSPAEAAPAAPGPPTLRGLLRAGLIRLWPRPAGSRTAVQAQAQIEHPLGRDQSGHLVPFADEGMARRVIAVLAFGLEPQQRMTVLDMALRVGTERGIVPLILTDDDDFAPLRSRGMAFEYFPPRSVREVLAPTLEWELYLQRRLALIRRKWRPTRIVAFGRPAADVIRLWSESPFEDRSIAALLTTASAARSLEPDQIGT
jgi:hypothetical protein